MKLYTGVFAPLFNEGVGSFFFNSICFNPLETLDGRGGGLQQEDTY